MGKNPRYWCKEPLNISSWAHTQMPMCTHCTLNSALLIATQTWTHQEQHSAVVQVWTKKQLFRWNTFPEMLELLLIPNSSQCHIRDSRKGLLLSPALAGSRDNLPLQKMHTAAKCHTSTFQHLLQSRKNTRHRLQLSTWHWDVCPKLRHSQALGKSAEPGLKCGFSYQNPFIIPAHLFKSELAFNPGLTMHGSNKNSKLPCRQLERMTLPSKAVGATSWVKP